MSPKGVTQVLGSGTGIETPWEELPWRKQINPKQKGNSKQKGNFTRFLTLNYDRDAKFCFFNILLENISYGNLANKQKNYLRSKNHAGTECVNTVYMEVKC